MIKGIIFDMDGVISDTQELHATVESRILKKFEIEIPPDEITRRFAGVKTKEFLNELLRKQPQDYDIDGLMKEKWETMAKLSRGNVKEMPDATGLIKMLHENGFPLAVASASDLKYVSSVLKKLEVENYFKAIIGGDMVSKGKPDPEIFLLAAKKINIEPVNCLVIEDGTNGMEAAKLGGMQCIGLVTDLNKKYPTENLVAELSEITVEYIGNL
jgi:beta-phosphoglucomutase family hydrolase